MTGLALDQLELNNRGQRSQHRNANLVRRLFKIVLGGTLVIALLSVATLWWWMRQAQTGEIITDGTTSAIATPLIQTTLPRDWPISIVFPNDLKPVPVATDSGAWVWRAYFKDYSGSLSVYVQEQSASESVNFVWQEIPDIALRQRLPEQYQLWRDQPHQQIWLGEREVVSWTRLDNLLVRVSLYDLKSPPAEHTRWLTDVLATLRANAILE